MFALSSDAVTMACTCAALGCALLVLWFGRRNRAASEAPIERAVLTVDQGDAEPSRDTHDPATGSQRQKNKGRRTRKRRAPQTHCDAKANREHANLTDEAHQSLLWTSNQDSDRSGASHDPCLSDNDDEPLFFDEQDDSSQCEKTRDHRATGSGLADDDLSTVDLDASDMDDVNDDDDDEDEDVDLLPADDDSWSDADDGDDYLVDSTSPLREPRTEVGAERRSEENRGMASQPSDPDTVADPTEPIKEDEPAAVWHGDMCSSWAPAYDVTGAIVRIIAHEQDYPE